MPGGWPDGLAATGNAMSAIKPATSASTKSFRMIYVQFDQEVIA